VSKAEKLIVVDQKIDNVMISRNWIAFGHYLDNPCKTRCICRFAKHLCFQSNRDFRILDHYLMVCMTIQK